MKTEINLLLDFEANARPQHFKAIFGEHIYKYLWNQFTLNCNYSVLALYRQLDQEGSEKLETYLNSCLIAA